MDFSLSEEQEELHRARHTHAWRRTAADSSTWKERDRSDDWYDLPTWHGSREGEPARASPCPSRPATSASVPRRVHGAAGGRRQRCAASAIPFFRRARCRSHGCSWDTRQAILGQTQRAAEVFLTATLRGARCRARAAHDERGEKGDGWRIKGIKSKSPGAPRRKSYRTRLRRRRRGRRCSWYRGNSQGPRRARQQTINHEPLYEMQLDGVHVDDDTLLGSLEQGAGDSRVHAQPYRPLRCLRWVSGLSERALRMTAQ